jgi:ribosome recycling factor
MKKTVAKLKTELLSIKINRASSALVNEIKININGNSISLKNIATINIPNGHTIEIIPWDYSYNSKIEKAIIEAKIGLMPSKINQMVRIIVPKLTDEKRHDLIKTINNIGESFKINIRNERRTILNKIKKMEKSKLLTQDEKKRYEKETQNITNQYIQSIDKSINLKVKEILSI